MLIWTYFVKWLIPVVVFTLSFLLLDLVITASDQTDIIYMNCPDVTLRCVKSHLYHVVFTCCTWHVFILLRVCFYYCTAHTNTHLTALFLDNRLSRYQKGKPIWILLKQETVSGSGISWDICKSAPRSRQITTPAPHHSVFLQAGCPSCRPTNSVNALKALLSYCIHCLFPLVTYQFAACAIEYQSSPFTLWSRVLQFRLYTTRRKTILLLSERVRTPLFATLICWKLASFTADRWLRKMGLLNG